MDVEKINYENEIWKDIEGYKGYYQASNKGRIRSLSRQVIVHTKNGEYIRNKKGQILSLGKNTNNGYLTVNLSVEGKRKSHDVHRLIAETFISRIEGKDCIDHINHDKHDNRVENLRWVTQLENVRHSIEAGRVNLNERIAILKNPEVIEKRLKATQHPVIRSDGKIFKSVTEAARETGCDRRAITLVINGKNKTCKGYTFKYYYKGDDF